MIVLKLNTPFDPGMYDQGSTYPHALVTNFNCAVMAQIIEIGWEYGTLDPAKGWVSGKAGLPQRTILQNEDYAKALQAMPADGSSDSILMAVARECYTVLSETAAAPGEVVDIEITGATEQPAVSSGAGATSGESATPKANVKQKSASK